MGFDDRTPPDGVSLGPLSQQVFEILAEHTSFPWPIMQAQCKRVDADPENIVLADMDDLVEFLSAAVGRFTSSERQEAVHARLEALSH